MKPVALLVFVVAMAAKAAVPQGWNLNGPGAGDYTTRIVTTARGNAVELSSTSAQPAGYVVLEQAFEPRYASGTVRFSAEIRADGVTGWAGLWLRSEPQGGEGGTTLEEPRVFFDNMQNRPLRGTREWARHEIVLPCGSSPRLSLGILLDGAGTVTVRNLRFERVEATGATTALCCGPAPAARNMDFRHAAESATHVREGWYRNGDVQVETIDGPEGNPALHIEGRGAVLQAVSALPFRGQRVALAGQMADDGGLVLSVHPRASTFDSYTIGSGSNWAEAQVEIDVPSDADELVFGVDARGSVRVTQLRLTSLGPTSSMVGPPLGALPDDPVLDFE